MFRQYYEIDTFVFSLSTDSDALSPGLALLYPALHSSMKPGKCSVEWRIREINDKRDGAPYYASYEDDKLICHTGNLDRLLENLEWNITMRILREKKRFLQLHASGLVVGGRAFLLIGPSGCGKTSFALSLLLQGWKCLSDEVILIEPAHGKAWPLPRCFHVESKTLSFFPELMVNNTGDMFLDNSGKRLFDPAHIRSDWVAEPSSPGWLVFLSYSPGNHNGLIPIGETEAFALLLGQTINLADHGEKGLDILMQVVRRSKCFKLNAGDVRYASLGLSNVAKQEHESVFLHPALG